jgi:hypothetical protein
MPQSVPLSVSLSVPLSVSPSGLLSGSLAQGTVSLAERSGFAHTRDGDGARQTPGLEVHSKVDAWPGIRQIAWHRQDQRLVWRDDAHAGSIGA